MKKVLVLCIAALSLFAVSCKEDTDQSGIDWSKVTVDGFYVAGPATGSDEIKPECVMAAGFNEVDKAVRDGMYEKYIVLEGGKDFYLAYSDGGKLTYYSAKLAEFVTPEEEAYSDNPAKVLKGELIIGDSPVAMKVEKTGLYHIVLDINKNKDLKNAQIVLLDASDFGVRGGMNGWGFTSSDPKPEFSNAGTTFTFKDQELGKGGEFKFATGNYWKVTLDDAGKVKAEVSLAEGMTLNGANIKVEKGGTYDITLTFKLAQGSFDKNFSYTAVCTKESTAPETMYMIGAQWGNWSWDDAGVVEMVPVWGAPGYFWATRYFQAGGEFKFCAQKAWNGDFGDNGNNVKIDNAGFYTILVNGNDNAFEIKPAEVYVIGVCGTPKTADQDVWDFGGADVLKFEADGEVLKATLASNGELRLASKVHPAAAIDGVTTGNGWIDWWKTEFIFFDGKIAYRGAGNDQERVQGEAGKEIILDFNAGTVTVEDGTPFVPAVTIDGNFDDWASVASATEGCHTIKITSDEKNVYFYSLRSKEGRYSEIWGGNGYIYIGVDGDNNMETGVELWGNGLYEFIGVFYPYAAAGTFKANPGDACMPDSFTLANATCAGKESDAGAEVEICVPRKDLPAFPATEMTIYSWGNKDLTKVSIKATL